MSTHAHQTILQHDRPQEERRLRLLTLAMLSAQALYWAYTMWVGLSRAEDHRGYQWMGAFFSTPAFIVFTVPALILHMTGILRGFTLIWAWLGLLLVPLVLWGMAAAALTDALGGF